MMMRAAFPLLAFAAVLYSCATAADAQSAVQSVSLQSLTAEDGGRAITVVAAPSTSVRVDLPRLPLLPSLPILSDHFRSPGNNGVDSGGGAGNNNTTSGAPPPAIAIRLSDLELPAPPSSVAATDGSGDGGRRRRTLSTTTPTTGQGPSAPRAPGPPPPAPPTTIGDLLGFGGGGDGLSDAFFGRKLLQQREPSSRRPPRQIPHAPSTTLGDLGFGRRLRQQQHQQQVHAPSTTIGDLGFGGRKMLSVQRQRQEQEAGAAPPPALNDGRAPRTPPRRLLQQLREQQAMLARRNAPAARLQLTDLVWLPGMSSSGADGPAPPPSAPQRALSAGG